ncbi:hypothetical protein [Lacipirellula parvula]|uniref:Uncharacterized protein n=1 Tax=Lacipirellula parvula TaxID=2650471 RepID=A0A5K7XD31_9BACT|nr:hypothetical protein [Lacipirellula parvula]BBO34295.1 hypothetical protein PLANPX_3907 [Lacipirellula parvula]
MARKIDSAVDMMRKEIFQIYDYAVHSERVGRLDVVVYQWADAKDGKPQFACSLKMATDRRVLPPCAYKGSYIPFGQHMRDAKRALTVAHEWISSRRKELGLD